jgi:O-antigen/teichoic acid export membrane protein
LTTDPSARQDRLGRRQYLRHFLVILGGNGAAQATNLLGYPLLAHLYSPHEFGAFGLFVAASAVPGALASARLEYAMPTAPEDGAPGVLWLALFSSGAMGLLSFFISAFIWPSWAEPILFGLCVFLTGVCAAFSAFLLRHERYRLVSASVVLRTATAILAQASFGFVSASAVSSTAAVIIVTVWA